LPSTLFHLLLCVSLFVLVAAVHHFSGGDFKLVPYIESFFKERCTNIWYHSMHIL
jgi:hypothetical protein